MKTSNQWLNGLAIATLVALCFGAGLFGRYVATPKDAPAAKSDTVVRIDTLFQPVPKPIYVTNVRVDTVLLERVDTLHVGDTVKVPVPIPITQKTYKTDTYEAWVSGYKPELDSINVFTKTQIITNDVPLPVAKRFGVGVQLGIGATSKFELTPYVGIGVTYNIFSW